MAKYRFDLKHRWWFSSLLFVASSVYLLIGVDAPPNLYDEGIPVYGALRVMEGDVPYRDFWTMYSPGQFYLLAVLFKLFGASLIVERVWDILIRSALSVTVYSMAKRLTASRTAVLSWAVAVIWLGHFNIFSYQTFPALMLGMASMVFLHKFFAGRRPRRALFAGGALAGIAAVFRHDLGFYACVSGLAVVLPFSHLNSRRPGDSKDLPRMFESFAWYALGVVLFLSPMVIYLLARVPAHELGVDLFQFPAGVFPLYRSLPYPSPFPDPRLLLSGDLTSYAGSMAHRVPFYFPPAVFSLTIISQWMAARKRVGSERDELWGTVLVILFGVLCLNQVRVRSDLVHLAMPFLPAVALLSVLLHDVRRISGKTFSAGPVLAYLLVLSVLVGPAVARARLIGGKLSATSGHRHDVERGKHIQLERDQVEALRFIRVHTDPDSPIYVGNSRHDRVYVNDVIFYFLAERNCATKYHELHPGLATTQANQRKIAEELEGKHVEYVVLFSKYEDVVEPNLSGVSSGVGLLDDHIRANFALVERFGFYTVWKRRPPGG